MVLRLQKDKEALSLQKKKAFDKKTAYSATHTAVCA